MIILHILILYIYKKTYFSLYTFNFNFYYTFVSKTYFIINVIFFVRDFYFK